MDTIKLWARNGDAVRQAIALGELVHLETASEELTDALLLFAIESGLLTHWAEPFTDPRCEPEIGMEDSSTSSTNQRPYDEVYQTPRLRSAGPY